MKLQLEKTKLFLAGISIFILIGYFTPLPSFGFSRIVDLLLNNESVKPEDFITTLAKVKKNPNKNKLRIVEAMLANTKNIQFEVDTSGVIIKNEDDIQAPVTNQGFLDAIQEAIDLWENVDIADVSFAPLKFASGSANADDGKNIISFRAAEPPEGVPDGANYISIINYARNETIVFMNKSIMVKPGTILDSDIIFDPTNNPCLALQTTVGDFKIGGEDVEISEGGIDSSADLSLCQSVSGGDITELATQGIASSLGLDPSAIASAATSSVAEIRERYALTSDDKIGLANVYPNKKNLKNRGSIRGKVLLEKKPVVGAHVVLEDNVSGEPVVSTITNIKGQFSINHIPEGTYTVYAEPLDGPARKNTFPRVFYGSVGQLNFTTGIFPKNITIRKNKATSVLIKVKELSASAFNINYQTVALTEADVNEFGGAFLLPIRIMPGETLTDVQFWGDNISTGFGTLSISGPGITISNERDASIPISPFVKCEECEDSVDDPCKRDSRCPPTTEIIDEPDQIQGIIVDITCDPDIEPGPRNIIFTGNQIDPEHPSFGLRDQISGGLTVTEE
jgi:hypothetical protein